MFSEIPLFHVVSAKVTFGNLNGCDTPVPHVETLTTNEPLPLGVTSSPTRMDLPNSAKQHDGVRKRHGDIPLVAMEVPCEDVVDVLPGSKAGNQKCVIKESTFAVPDDYRKVVSYGSQQPAYNEEELLQMAIEQSLLEQGPLPVGGSGLDLCWAWRVLFTIGLMCE